MAVAVDVDLFVKSASQGFNDGLKSGSDFSNFTNAFIKGIDEQQNYETEEQQQQIRAAQIEQIPNQQRISEAQATRAEAETALYKSDPGAYLQRQQDDAKAKQMQDQQTQQILSQKVEFQKIMQSGDGAAQGDAVMSGKFNDYFSADPKARENAIDGTIGNWAPEYQQQYQDNERIKRETENLTKNREKRLQKANEAVDSLDTDGEMSRIRELAGNVATDDFIRKGRVSYVKVPATIEQADVDESGQPKMDEDGFPLYKSVPNPDPLAQPKRIKTFIYDGKPIRESDGTPVEIRDENIFTKAQRGYNFKNTLLPEQTQNKREGAIKSSDEQRVAREAAQNAAKNADPAEAQRMQDNFFAGASITKPYSEAAERVKQQIQQSRNPTFQREAGPGNATPIKTVEGSSEGVTPIKLAGTPDVPMPVQLNMSGGAPVIMTPSASGTQFAARVPKPPAFVGPVQVDPLTELLGKNKQPAQKAAEAPDNGQLAGFTYAPAALPNGQKAPATQRESLAQAKAASFLAKRAPAEKGTPPPAVAAAMESNIPRSATPMTVAQVPEITINPSIKHQVNTAAIERISARPEVQGLSALAKAIMAQESQGLDNQTSPTGVKGTMQVTRGTANGISPGVDRENPVNSAMLGAIEIEKAMMTPQFNENPMLGISAYNLGAAPVAAAVRLARSTDWNVVKKFLPAAIRQYDSYWKSIGVDTERKVTEGSEYAERVIANFPAFIATDKDMSTAQKLKQQRIILF